MQPARVTLGDACEPIDNNNKISNKSCELLLRGRPPPTTALYLYLVRTIRNSNDSKKVR